MTLGRRIEKLEGRRGMASRGPSVIFLCSGEAGEPMSAILMGGTGLIREDGETPEAFRARADEMAKSAPMMVVNKRKRATRDPV